MRYVVAVVAGLVVGLVVAFLMTLVLGILGLYLSEQGVTWHSKEFNWRFVHVATFDVVLLVAPVISFVGVYILILKTWPLSDPD